MDMVNVKINGIAVSVPKGATVLEAARYAGVEIPTLCFLKEINEIGACRICMVEVSEGGRPARLVTACVYPVSEGMEVVTSSPRIEKSRKTTLEMILSTHEKKCLSCVRSTNCELQKMCRDYGVEDSGKYDTTIDGAGKTWRAYKNNLSVDPADITWTVDDPSICTIENGIVTAVARGKTEIHAQYGGKTYTLSLGKGCPHILDQFLKFGIVRSDIF